MKLFSTFLTLILFLNGCANNSLADAFKRLPEASCPTSMREPTLVYDEDNSYMKTGTDLSLAGAKPSYNYCEFKIFTNESGQNVYAIVSATVTPMAIFSSFDFFEMQNGEFISVKEEIMSHVDSDQLAKNSAASIEKNRPELIGEKLEENYYMELSRDTSDINFIHYNTGETIYTLKWTDLE